MVDSIEHMCYMYDCADLIGDLRTWTPMDAACQETDVEMVADALVHNHSMASSVKVCSTTYNVSLLCPLEFTRFTETYMHLRTRILSLNLRICKTPPSPSLRRPAI